jgi:hypothetical protein
LRWFWVVFTLAGVSVHEAIDALVHDILKDLNRSERDSQCVKASTIIGSAASINTQRGDQESSSVDLVSALKATNLRESTAGITDAPLSFDYSPTTDQSQPSTTVTKSDPPPATNDRVTNMSTAARVLVAVGSDGAETAAKVEAEATQSRDAQARRTRIAKYERKVARIRVRIFPFVAPPPGAQLTITSRAGAGGRVLPAIAYRPAAAPRSLVLSTPNLSLSLYVLQDLVRTELSPRVLCRGKWCSPPYIGLGGVTGRTRTREAMIWSDYTSRRAASTEN